MHALAVCVMCLVRNDLGVRYAVDAVRPLRAIARAEAGDARTIELAQIGLQHSRATRCNYPTCKRLHIVDRTSERAVLVRVVYIGDLHL